MNFRLALKLIPVIAALALAGALFLPLGCGNVYSMHERPFHVSRLPLGSVRRPGGK